MHIFSTSNMLVCMFCLYETRLYQSEKQFPKVICVPYFPIEAKRALMNWTHSNTSSRNYDMLEMILNCLFKNWYLSLLVRTIRNCKVYNGSSWQLSRHLVRTNINLHNCLRQKKFIFTWKHAILMQSSYLIVDCNEAIDFLI